MSGLLHTHGAGGSGGGEACADAGVHGEDGEDGKEAQEASRGSGARGGVSCDALRDAGMCDADDCESDTRACMHVIPGINHFCMWFRAATMHAVCWSRGAAAQPFLRPHHMRHAFVVCVRVFFCTQG